MKYGSRDCFTICFNRVRKSPLPCGWKDVEILEECLIPDYTYMLLGILSKYSVSNFIGYLKVKGTLMIFDRYTTLKYKFGTDISEKNIT